MKYSEIKDENLRKARIQYIDECWGNHSEWRTSSLSRITNYVFVLNSGGLLAALAYVATKTCTVGMNLSIYLFALGTLCITLHATLDYYISQKTLTSFRTDINEFYNDKIEWEVFVDRTTNRIGSDWYMQVLGWLSGLLFFAGLFIGIRQIS